MNRIIKFRAWDKEKYCWIEDFFVKDGQAWFLDDDGACGDPECCGERSYFMSPIEGAILCQFTGLLDKNGKEIYESDIVKVFEGLKGERIDEVIFNDYTAGFALKQSPGGHLFSGHLIEVIGNIYEHPHLLTPHTEERTR